MKTFVPKVEEVQRDWYVVDAEGQTPGRLAARVADILRGKHKPIFTPHMDCGDFVVVVNAEKIKVTGNKMEAKLYRHHSGYPGGFKIETMRHLKDRRPEAIVEKAIKGMLPHTRLGARQFTKLKVYVGTEHPHQAQNPKKLELRF
ncbi:MAG: 50S ribosomal protein L13 [Candidatus Obscuribacterales bacterium]|nr:50S ribosomal protein L13 [Candidatus Obscuribacterales bacterium]